MSDQQLNDFVSQLFHALPGWVQALVAFMAGVVGISAWRRGEKDRKTMAGNTMEIPIYLVSGPIADAIREMHDMSEGVRDINEKYQRALDVQAQVLQEMRRQTQLLEAMYNSNQRAAWEQNNPATKKG